MSTTSTSDSRFMKLVMVVVVMGACLVACRLLAADVSTEDAQALIDNVAHAKEIEHQQAEVLADKLLSDARAKFDELDFAGAKADAEKCLTYAPDHGEARKLLAQINGVLGVDARSAVDALVDQTIEERTIANQLARIEAENAFDAAVDLFNDRQFDEALTMFTQVELMAGYLGDDRQAAELSRRAEGYIARAREGLQTQARLSLEREQREAERVMREQLAARERSERQRVERLLAQSKQQLEERNYSQAGQLAGEVLRLQPNNRAAIELRHQSLARAHAAVAARTERETRTARAWQQSELAAYAIPQHELVTYPDDWDSRGRKTRLEYDGGRDEENAPWRDMIQKAMESEVTFDFVDTPLPDVITFLHELTGVVFVLDRAAMPTGEVPRVTLSVTDITLSNALGWILRLSSMSYTLRDEAVFISTKENIKEESVLRLYDVTDLTVDLRDFRANTQAISVNYGEEGDDDPWGRVDEFGPPDSFTGETLVEFIKQALGEEVTMWEVGGRDYLAVPE